MDAYFLLNQAPYLAFLVFVELAMIVISLYWSTLPLAKCGTNVHLWRSGGYFIKHGGALEKDSENSQGFSFKCISIYFQIYDKMVVYLSGYLYGR
jgi:hypothetical protein